MIVVLQQDAIMNWVGRRFQLSPTVSTGAYAARDFTTSKAKRRRGREDERKRRALVRFPAPPDLAAKDSPALHPMTIMHNRHLTARGP